MTAGFVLTFISGCDKPPPPAAADFLPTAKIKVVTTTVQLAELAREIGGEAVVVECLLAPTPPPAPAPPVRKAGDPPVAEPEPPPWNPNPFVWKLRANDLFSMRTSHVILMNGLGLERISESQLSSMRSDNVILAIAGDALPEEERLFNGTEVDPCFWNSPRLWKYAVEATSAALKKCVRPEAQEYFDNRAHVIEARLDQMMTWAEGKLSYTNEKGNRFLLSSHRSLQYFGKDFGIETRAVWAANGEPLPVVETELREWLSKHQVTDFFPDASIPLHLADEVAAKLGLIQAKPIYSLFPGRPGAKAMGLLETYDVGTYEGSFRFMVRTMERHLGGVKPAPPSPAAAATPVPAAASAPESPTPEASSPSGGSPAK